MCHKVRKMLGLPLSPPFFQTRDACYDAERQLYSVEASPLTLLSSPVMGQALNQWKVDTYLL